MEPSGWKVQELPINPKEMILISESISSPTSPVPNPTSSLSSDSGLGSRPESMGSPTTSMGSPTTNFDQSLSLDVMELSSPRPNLPFYSQRILTSSGPGFSLGLINCETGTMDRLLVPVPSQILDSPSMDLMSFTLSEILSMCMMGESQLWVGTDHGTLHCFEISHDQNQSNYKLKQHTFIAINEPILSITARPIEHSLPHHELSTISSTSLSTQAGHSNSEILLGVPYGYIVILQGEVDQKGRLKDPLEKMSRRIVRLTNSPVDCAVNCIVHSLHNKEEAYWCACGGSIIVLNSSNWKQVAHIDIRQGQPVTPTESLSQEVIQLLSTEVGIWSALSMSSTVTLWNKADYSPMIQITYCDYYRSLQIRSDVSTFHYSSPLLFIGTQRGDIMVFNITEKLTQSSELTISYQKNYDYKYMTSTHVGPHPIVKIYTNTLDERPSDLSSTTPLFLPSIHILIVQSGGEKTSGQIHLMEYCHSPSHSLRSSPTLSVCSDSTVGSLRNTSLTPRRLSVISSTMDYIPLKN